jgi:hypothetical protein
VFSHQQVTTIFDIEVLRKYSEMVPDAPKCISLVFEQISAAKRQLREESLWKHQPERDLREFAVNCQTFYNRLLGGGVFAIIIAGMIATVVFAALGKQWLSGVTQVVVCRICRDRIPAEVQKNQRPPVQCNISATCSRTNL